MRSTGIRIMLVRSASSPPSRSMLATVADETAPCALAHSAISLASHSKCQSTATIHGQMPHAANFADGVEPNGRAPSGSLDTHSSFQTACWLDHG